MIELVGCRHVNMQALAICVTALYVVQACKLHTMNNIQCAYSVHTTRTMQARGTTRLTTRRTDCGVAKAWYPVVSVLGGGYHRVPRRTTPVPRVGTAWVRRGYGVGTAWVRRGYGVGTAWLHAVLDRQRATDDR